MKWATEINAHPPTQHSETERRVFLSAIIAYEQGYACESKHVSLPIILEQSTVLLCALRGALEVTEPRLTKE
jgi:hypothetical protein